MSTTASITYTIGKDFIRFNADGTVYFTFNYLDASGVAKLGKGFTLTNGSIIDNNGNVVITLPQAQQTALANASAAVDTLLTTIGAAGGFASP